MYPSSLLSHSGHIFGSIPIITQNLCHTMIAYIYDRLGLGSDCLIGLGLSSVRVRCGKVRLGLGVVRVKFRRLVKVWQGFGLIRVRFD